NSCSVMASEFLRDACSESPVEADERVERRRSFAIVDGAAVLHAPAQFAPGIVLPHLLVENVTSPVVPEIFLPIAAAGEREPMTENAVVAPPNEMFGIDGQRGGEI